MWIRLFLGQAQDGESFSDQHRGRILDLELDFAFALPAVLPEHARRIARARLGDLLDQPCPEQVRLAPREIGPRRNGVAAPIGLCCAPTFRERAKHVSNGEVRCGVVLMQEIVASGKVKYLPIALAAAIACCASLQPVAADAGANREKVLYSFCQQQNCADGSQVASGLIDIKGTLYGTTLTGGSYGGGTVFAIDRRTGTERVIYAFCGEQNCADGELPAASLIARNGVLYGTTNSGGANGGGTVFALDRKTGAETVLYSFCSRQNCTDGQSPSASLVWANGKLYGTTFYGGANDDGTVFVLDPATRAETVLHTFCAQQGCADGALPSASLIDVNGVLYGTTDEGGAAAAICSTGCGTVFALNPETGSETVLYAFCQQQNCADGAYPVAGLTGVNALLYGTTEFGGAGNGGSVFALDPKSGAETVLYSFCVRRNCKDGYEVTANLLSLNGLLYGTTLRGGTAGCGGSGCGTVFRLDPVSGDQTLLYSFCTLNKCVDGAYPNSGLLPVTGGLYSTTLGGGSSGNGTAFRITAP